MLSLAGDIGCTTGPALVGLTADALGGDLGVGMLLGAMFPALLVILLLIFKPNKQQR